MSLSCNSVVFKKVPLVKKKNVSNRNKMKRIILVSRRKWAFVSTMIWFQLRGHNEDLCTNQCVQGCFWLYTSLYIILSHPTRFISSFVEFHFLSLYVRQVLRITRYFLSAHSWTIYNICAILIYICKKFITQNWSFCSLKCVCFKYMHKLN